MENEIEAKNADEQVTPSPREQRLALGSSGVQEPEQEKCGTTHYAGCACHEQGWEKKWNAAVEMAARATVERDEVRRMSSIHQDQCADPNNAKRERTGKDLSSMKACKNCGWVGGNAGCDVCRPIRKRCFKSLVAEMLNGRAWSDLDNLEGAIFDRLQDAGHLRTVRGIVVWTPLHTETFQPRLVRCCACDGTGRNPHLPHSPTCYTCEGIGSRPTCYRCATPLYRNSFTDGWFCCVRCEEARTQETTDFLSANRRAQAPAENEH